MGRMRCPATRASRCVVVAARHGPSAAPTTIVKYERVTFHDDTGEPEIAHCQPVSPPRSACVCLHLPTMFTQRQRHTR